MKFQINRDIFKKKERPSEPFIEGVSRHLRAADEHVKKKRYDDALAEIERAFEIDPKNMYIRSFLERVRYLIQKESEKKSKVFGEMDSTIERRMETISQLLISAEQFIKAKKYKRALEAVAKIYQIDPRNHYAQIFSERIEELMQAEEVGKGVVAPARIPEPLPPQSSGLALHIPSMDRLSTTSPRYIEEAPTRPSRLETPVGESQVEAGRFALYRELLKECWADGVINPEESAMLHRMRTQYSISFEDHCRIEIGIKIDAYVDALQIVWQDGVVNDNEQEVLEIMRKKFGITPDEQAAAEKRFSLLRATNQPQATLLIVDSDQDELISVARALISRGYDVKVTRHPDDALRFLRSHTPDLILSEVVFPQLDTDGFEFYQKVRANEKWNQIPFLMMTYPGDARIVRAGLRMGVDYFLPKPLHTDFMIAIVEGKLKTGRQPPAIQK
jgi:CheY-like chemotaxis protein